MNALLWQEKSLSLLDQSRYPEEEIWHDIKNYRALVNILHGRAVSGESILKIAAAYGYCLAALELEGDPSFFKKLSLAKKGIQNSRPESGAISEAFAQMDRVYEEYRTSPELTTALLAAAVTIHRKDVVASRAMSRHGREIIPPEANLVLSCRDSVFHSGNPKGPVGAIASAASRGKIQQVFLLENRPGLEGSTSIADELLKSKVKTTVIPDHAAASLMPSGSCDMVLLEGLRLAANGDLLAGPGTYELAITAYFHSIPVYATLFSQNIELSLPTGESFSLEEGPSPLIGQILGQTLLPDGVNTWTSNYDMLPHYLLTGLITDLGVIFPPYVETVPEALTKIEDKPLLFL